MPKKSTKAPVTKQRFVLPTDLVNRLREHAAAEHRNVSAMLQVILEEVLAEPHKGRPTRPKKEGKTR